MDVKTVCLGMLESGCASGYDLKKQFESSFGHFFAAGYGSIYPALSSLATQGLVECELIPQEGKPDRKVYRITEDGHAHLVKALDNPAPGHKVRSEFMAMMCFAHLMTEEQLDTVLDNRLSEVDNYLNMFDKIESDTCSKLRPGTQFVLGFGRAMTKTAKTYIEENRHLLLHKKTKRAATG